MGIEPTLSAWKAEVLPLNYTRAQSGKGIRHLRRLSRQIHVANLNRREHSLETNSSVNNAVASESNAGIARTLINEQKVLTRFWRFIRNYVSNSQLST